MSRFRWVDTRRANPPDAGLWGFPGGKIDQGEPLFDAAIRELAEETGVSAEPLRVITALDAFDHDMVLTPETGPNRVRIFGYISGNRGVYRCRRNDSATNRLPLH
ncbi:NUDIX domain-containing protein [Lutimaribacter pacificus]|uniref:NUDIX domain-containing protein n=1 Tax=Lutimaribacter pacificus TaxID=391948 RepID=UPI002110FBDE|nr:NUDIX domain-containing protein [Sagittula sp. P11]